MSNRWAIIFLIYADFREGKGIVLNEKLVRELNSLFRDLRCLKLNKLSKIFIIINRIRYEESVSNGFTNDKTFIYELTEKSAQKNTLRQLVLEGGTSQGPSLLQDDISLSKIFSEIYKLWEGSKIFLVTWDHGSVFGIFKENDTEKIEVKKFQALDALRDHFDKENQEFAVEMFRADAFLKSQVPKPIFENFVFQQPFFVHNGRTHYIKQEIPEGTREQLDEVIFSGHSLRLNANVGTGHLELIDGIGDIVLDVNNIFPETGKLFNNSTGTVHSLFFDHITTGEGTELTDMLSNEELSSAIKVGFKRNVDVLLMMNCYMMNVHTALALAGNVDFLVAPQGGIDEPGYNYTEILNAILHDGVSPQRLSEICVESTFIFNMPERAKFRDEINRWSIFSLKIPIDDTISSVINDFANYLLENWKDPDLTTQVRFCRKRSFRFDDSVTFAYNLIDILQFSEALAARLGEFPHLKQHFQAISKYVLSFHNLKKMMAIQEKVTHGDIYKVRWNNGNFNTQYHASGLSIFFPIKLNDENPIVQHFISIGNPFVRSKDGKKGTWLNLLEKFSDG